MRQANATVGLCHRPPPPSSQRQRPTAGLSANYKEVIVSTARNVRLYIYEYNERTLVSSCTVSRTKYLNPIGLGERYIWSRVRFGRQDPPTHANPLAPSPSRQVGTSTSRTIFYTVRAVVGAHVIVITCRVRNVYSTKHLNLLLPLAFSALQVFSPPSRSPSNLACSELASSTLVLLFS